MAKLVGKLVTFRGNKTQEKNAHKLVRILRCMLSAAENTLLKQFSMLAVTRTSDDTTEFIEWLSISNAINNLDRAQNLHCSRCNTTAALPISPLNRIEIWLPLFVAQANAVGKF